MGTVLSIPMHIKDLLLDESFVNAFTIISSLGAFISAIIAAITIREVKLQRQSSYMPELILETYTAYWYWDKSLNEHNNSFEFRTSAYNERKSDTPNPKGMELVYSFENIGLGAAKYINVDWEFNIKEMMEVLKSALPSNYVIEDDDVFNTPLLRRGNAEYIAWFNEIGFESVDFIMPGRSTKLLSIPDSIIKAFCYYLIFKENLSNPNNLHHYEDFFKFPDVFAIVTYQDVLGKRYKKKLMLIMSFESTLYRTEKEQNEMGVFNISVHEVKEPPINLGPFTWLYFPKAADLT